MNLFSLLQTKLKHCAAVFIFLSVMSCSFIPAYAPRAEAFTDNTLGEFGAWLQTGFTTLYTAASRAIAWTLQQKELYLDTLVWQLINMLLKQMVNDMTKWIKNGFKGEPAFMRDLDGFVKGIADNVAGSFIWGSDLNFLCSPFRLNVKLALEFQYSQARSFGSAGAGAKCTLSGVVKNMDAFLKGDFLQGGWDGWYSVTTVPQNNPYGSMVLAQEELSARISNAQGQEISLLNWGKGMLSQKECKFKPTDQEVPTDCKIITPGTAIEAQLNSALDSGQKRIQVADELGEMFSALFASLALEALKGGIMALTGDESGKGSYFAKIGSTTDATYGDLDTGIATPIATQLTLEIKYRDTIASLIPLIEAARTYKENRYGAASTCHTGNLPQNLVSELATLNRELTSVSTMVTNLTILSADYTTITSDTLTDAELNALAAKYGPTTKPEIEGAIMAAFTRYNSSLHDEVSADRVNRDENNKPSKIAIEKMIEDFKRDVDSACNTLGNGGGG